MQGTMMWFNGQKGYGVIQTDGGRVRVDVDGFEQGEVPTGRCAGQRVTLQCEGEGENARAIGVRFLTAGDPRRARLRSGRGTARAV
jgi:cold shock CspA family protein